MCFSSESIVVCTYIHNFDGYSSFSNLPINYFSNDQGDSLFLQYLPALLRGPLYSFLWLKMAAFDICVFVAEEGRRGEE